MQAALRGERLLERLWQDLREDPDAYGLRSRMTVMGRELVDAVASLGEPDDEQLIGFTARVAGPRSGVVDAVGRRAAARAGERLSVSHGNELFCLVYRQFFADVVAEFLRAVIAEEIEAAVPVLLLIDPAGQVADWVAGRLVALVPDPCAAVGPGRSLLEVANERVPEAVDAVLGLQEAA